MPKPSKHSKGILAVLMVTSLAYSWLMIRFHTVIPCDIAYSVADKEWTLDSVFVHRLANIVDPDQRLELTRRDTTWQLSGAIYAQNNLHTFLSVEGIQIQDHSASFSADVQIRWLIPPSRKDRANPHYFMNEPFAMVYELQWPATRMSPPEFNRFIDRAFNAHSLKVLVQTNHGSITISPRGYRTMHWGEFNHEYPPPRQVF